RTTEGGRLRSAPLSKRGPTGRALALLPSRLVTDGRGACSGRRAGEGWNDDSSTSDGGVARAELHGGRVCERAGGGAVDRADRRPALYSFGGGTDLQHGFGVDLRYQIFPERSMDGYVGLFSQ